jgi:hypothetical protein
VALLGQFLLLLFGAPPAPRRTVLSAALLWGSALALALFGLGFLATAIDLALAAKVGAPAAAFIVAGALLALAAVLLLVVLLRRQAALTRQPAPAYALADLLLRLGQSASAGLPPPNLAMVAAAALAGVAVGYSPGLRKWLKSLIG